MTSEDIVVAVISLNGGKLVGKTRLQKTLYLLEKTGMSFGFEFEYANFGPFSVDVAEATDFAVLEERLTSDKQYGYHQVPYQIFETTEDPPSTLGEIESGRAQELLELMSEYSAIEMELAATIAFLDEAGVPLTDIDPHVRELKPSKATGKRLARAHELLGELNLSPD